MMTVLSSTLKKESKDPNYKRTNKSKKNTHKIETYDLQIWIPNKIKRPCNENYTLACLRLYI